jgi:hypothetical protein
MRKRSFPLIALLLTLGLSLSAQSGAWLNSTGPPEPFEALSTVYLFPTYETRESYEEKTGKTCPPWNPYRAPKGWEDPEAWNRPGRTVLYEAALTGESIGGEPEVAFLPLRKEIAATVNIPPKGTGQTNVPGADVPEIPVPLDWPLPANRKLVYRFGNTVAVRNLDVPLPEEERDKTLKELLRLVQAIAAKQGIE